MRANDSGDTEDTKKNPYRDENIGVEKLLELNSEESHNDVCLAYVFTYRDFADGVLGLAWVGETGNQNYCLKFFYYNNDDDGHDDAFFETSIQYVVTVSFVSACAARQIIVVDIKIHYNSNTHAYHTYL